MPPSTRRQAHHHVPSHPADFSDSDQDVEEEEMEPEEEDGDALGDEMAAMEGEEDLEEEDGLGKPFLAACPGFLWCHIA
jgi:anaphase-promoting complex subunit 10